jgi:hypothetical protein
MPTILAENGIICENYPENVLFPGEKPAKAQKSKGINDLTKLDISRILEAFNDPNFPLVFHKVPADKKSKFLGLCFTHQSDLSSRCSNSIEGACYPRRSP